LDKVILTRRLVTPRHGFHKCAKTHARRAFCGEFLASL